MNVVLYKKDELGNIEGETCDQYKNHFISRVVFNTESQLYYIFENSRGTISDNKISVSVTDDKKQFDFKGDYVSFDTIRVKSVEIGVLQVFDKIVDKLVENATKQFKQEIKEQEENFAETFECLKKSMKKYFTWWPDYAFNDIGKDIQKTYKTVKWWKGRLE